MRHSSPFGTSLRRSSSNVMTQNQRFAFSPRSISQQIDHQRFEREAAHSKSHSQPTCVSFRLLRSTQPGPRAVSRWLIAACRCGSKSWSPFTRPQSARVQILPPRAPAIEAVCIMIFELDLLIQTLKEYCSSPISEEWLRPHRPCRTQPTRNSSQPNLARHPKREALGCRPHSSRGRHRQRAPKCSPTMASARAPKRVHTRELTPFSL